MTLRATVYVADLQSSGDVLELKLEFGAVHGWDMNQGRQYVATLVSKRLIPYDPDPPQSIGGP